MEALQQVRVVPQNDGDVKVKLFKKKKSEGVSTMSQPSLMLKQAISAVGFLTVE